MSVTKQNNIFYSIFSWHFSLKTFQVPAEILRFNWLFFKVWRSKVLIKVKQNYKLMNETLGIHLNFESIDFNKFLFLLDIRSKSKTKCIWQYFPGDNSFWNSLIIWWTTTVYTQRVPIVFFVQWKLIHIKCIAQHQEMEWCPLMYL